MRHNRAVCPSVSVWFFSGFLFQALLQLLQRPPGCFCFWSAVLLLSLWVGAWAGVCYFPILVTSPRKGL